MAGFPMIETGYKPEFALGAMFAGDNAAAVKNQQLLSQLTDMFQMKKQMQENDRYAAMTPNEIEKSNFEGAQARAQNTPAMLDAFIRGKTGEYGQKEAAGKEALGTVDTNIQAKNQSNLSDIQAKQMTDFIRGADAFIAVGGNPFALASQGIPKELIGQYSQLQQSGQLGKVLDNLKRQLADSVATRSAIAQEAPKLKSQEKIAAGHDATTLEAARIRSAAGKKDALTTIQQAVKNGKYEAASVAFGIMALQEEDPRLQQLYLQEAAKYEQMAKDRAAASRVNPAGLDIPAMTGQPGQETSPSRQKPEVQEKKTKSGNTYEKVN